MDLIKAIDKVMQDKALTPLDKSVLYYLITTANVSYKSYMHQTDIANSLQQSKRSVWESFRKLERDGYILRIDEGQSCFVPWPFLIEMRPKKDQHPHRRLTVTREQVSYLLSLVEREDLSLTVNAEAAQDRQNVKEHRRILALIDANNEIRDILQKYLERTRKEFNIPASSTTG